MGDSFTAAQVHKMLTRTRGGKTMLFRWTHNTELFVTNLVVKALLLAQYGLFSEEIREPTIFYGEKGALVCIALLKKKY